MRKIEANITDKFIAAEVKNLPLGGVALGSWNRNLEQEQKDQQALAKGSLLVSSNSAFNRSNTKNSLPPTVSPQKRSVNQN